MITALRSAVHRWFDRHDGQMDIAAGMIQALGRRISPRVACGWFAWHDWRDGKCAWCECPIYREQRTMIEAADAKPELGFGWHVVYDDHGDQDCAKRDANCVWFQPYYWGSDLPAGWTIAIADLLRDAARYRWVRDRIGVGFGATNPASGESLDAIVDAEMARERKPEDGE